MKHKGDKCLTRTQRQQLESLLKAKLHKKKIAEILGVCLTTVYNEIHRGAYEHRYNDHDPEGDRYYRYKAQYSSDLAQSKHEFNMTAKGRPLKIANDFEFVRYVEKRVLQDKLSPAAVLGEIKRAKMFRTNISKTTMYRYIADGIFLNISMKDLPVGLKRKRYRKAVAKRPPRGTSIEKRPAFIAERKEFGHWEMDCVIGKQNTKNVLLVLTERLTRKEIIFRMPNKKPESVVRCLNILERKYGKIFRKVFKTITVDNGVEFSDFNGIEKSIYNGKRVSVYYCHPYTSCERGTNERINREIRRRIPKGSDISRYSDKDIQTVENWINDYPRAIFGYATSAEMFDKQIANL